MDLVVPEHQLREADSSWRSRLDFRKSNSLKELAQKCIVNNKQSFVELYQRTKVNPFDQIYNFMKKDLITALLKSNPNSIIDFGFDTIELLLLNKKVLTFSIVSDKPYIDERIWSALTGKCPRLKQLCFRRHLPDFPTLLFVPISPILGKLTQMEKLCVLEVDLAFDDDDLCILAMSLPTLRVLQVQLLNDGVTKEGLSALSALSELREFIFWNKSTSKRWYLSQILESLPGLNVVGCRLQAEHDENIDDFTHNLEKILKIGQDLQYSVLTEHQLQELELVGFSHMPIRHLLFPQLKLLKLSSTYNLFSTDGFDFAQLTDLILNNFHHLDMFIPLLTVAGFKLRKLSLCVSSTLQLEKVLNLCPNLEEFHVVPTSKTDARLVIELINHLAPLPQLRVLKFTTYLVSDNNKSILFTLLKMMPNLQFLHLNLGSKMLMDDVVFNLHNSVICLQHLQSLSAKLQMMSRIAKMEWNRRIDYYSSMFFLRCPDLQDLNIERASYETSDV